MRRPSSPAGRAKIPPGDMIPATPTFKGDGTRKALSARSASSRPCRPPPRPGRKGPRLASESPARTASSPGRFHDDRAPASAIRSDRETPSESFPARAPDYRPGAARAQGESHDGFADRRPIKPARLLARSSDAGVPPAGILHDRTISGPTRHDGPIESSGPNARGTSKPSGRPVSPSLLTRRGGGGRKLPACSQGGVQFPTGGIPARPGSPRAPVPSGGGVSRFRCEAGADGYSPEERE